MSRWGWGARGGRLLVLVPVIALSGGVGLGCYPEGGGFSLTPICTNHLRDPDFRTDPNNCGGCDIVCNLVGSVQSCVEGRCVAAGCIDGFIDVDDDLTNGCECQGDTADTCRLCLPYEIGRDRVDNNCDGRTDEKPAKEYGSPVPLTRVDCGGVGVSCLLPPGATGVECAFMQCTREQLDSGACGQAACAPEEDDPEEDDPEGDDPEEDDERLLDCGVCLPVGAGEAGFEHADDCFDGVDNDRNGIVDDGPFCEVLLTNAVTSACSGEEPSAECPPNHITVPVGQPQVKSIEIAMTYDFLLDRYEVTRGQYAMFLHENGVCLTWPDWPGCRVGNDEAMLPVSEVSWCDAAAYCVWSGKRLPTLAEFYRAANADQTTRGFYQDAQGEGREPRCDTEPRPVTVRCGADGPVEVWNQGGEAVIGAYGRWDVWLIAMSIYHLTGNVAEWVIDAPIDWCEAARSGVPGLKHLRCPAPDEDRWAWQRAPLRDLETIVWRSRNPRLLCGGGYKGEPDSDRYEYQEFAGSTDKPGPHGFRCAHSLVPDGREHALDRVFADDWAEVAYQCW